MGEGRGEGARHVPGVTTSHNGERAGARPGVKQVSINAGSLPQKQRRLVEARGGLRFEDLMGR